MSSVDTPEGAPGFRKRKRAGWKRYVFAGVGAAIVIGTFAIALPKIANYRDVWDVVSTLSWQWIAILVGATILNLATFAPPWMVTLPGLSFRQAMAMTQASTALSIVAPGGAAIGMAGSFGMLRAWGFKVRDVTRAVTITGVWNQLANLVFPVVALFMLKADGGETALLGTAAFVGVVVLGVVLAILALVFYSDALARDVGDAVAQAVSFVLRRIRRRPVTWGGVDFARFRGEAVELLTRRWHVLTLATFGGSLTVFLLLVLSLRAVGVTGGEVDVIEIFAAWSLIRIIGAIPITPGGFGIVELGLTSALVAFGGSNAEVVAGVLIYRFLTVVPTLALGGLAALTFRSHARRGREEIAMER